MADGRGIIGRLLVVIRGDNRSAVDALKQTEAQAQATAASVERSAQRVEGGLGRVGGSINDATGGFRKLTGAITGTIGAITRMFGVIGLVVSAITAIIAGLEAWARRQQELREELDAYNKAQRERVEQEARGVASVIEGIERERLARAAANDDAEAAHQLRLRRIEDERAARIAAVQSQFGANEQRPDDFARALREQAELLERAAAAGEKLSAEQQLVLDAARAVAEAYRVAVEAQRESVRLRQEQQDEGGVKAIRDREAAERKAAEDAAEHRRREEEALERARRAMLDERERLELERAEKLADLERRGLQDLAQGWEEIYRRRIALIEQAKMRELEAIQARLRAEERMIERLNNARFGNLGVSGGESGARQILRELGEIERNTRRLYRAMR